jgi:hypothetical protein
LKTLIIAARTWQSQGAAVTPDPIVLTQINAKIAGQSVVLAWNPTDSDWEVSAS